MTTFDLTLEQKKWFFERLDENQRGQVSVPAYCYVKFKKLVGDSTLSNTTIKSWLVTHIYNSKHIF